MFGFLRKGPSSVVIRLVDLFPPQILEGPPPPDGGRQRFESELFFMTAMAAQHGGERVVLYIADPFPDPE